MICHKADLRFVSISGQKVLDSLQGAQEREGRVDPALEETQQLVSDRLQDATQRYGTLHSKVGWARARGRSVGWRMPGGVEFREGDEGITVISARGSYAMSLPPSILE